MKIVRNILLYPLATLFLFMGSIHFIMPERYFAMMPSWLPLHTILIYLSGIIEITLAILIIPIGTRAISAKIIIVMLFVFLFVIHIPESIEYYQTGNKDFVTSIIRLLIQFLLIAWAWMFTKKTNIN